MRKFLRDRDAVSPVVGVILMVAITVVLAAIIAAFVFGLGGGVKKTYNVAATAARVDADTVRITYTGGPDAASLDSFASWTMYNLTNPSNVISCSTTALGGDPNDGNAVNVGNMSTCDVPGTSAGTRIHVVLVGQFMDGSTQVILETDV